MDIDIVVMYSTGISFIIVVAFFVLYTLGTKPPVLSQYMLSAWQFYEYQHLPELEHTEFFQNILKNVFATFWFSML